MPENLSSLSRQSYNTSNLFHFYFFWQMKRKNKNKSNVERRTVIQTDSFTKKIQKHPEF